MPITPEEIDAADALVRERFDHARLVEASLASGDSRTGAARLARWAPDASEAQVDHLVAEESQDETVSISVRTVRDLPSPHVLRRMHGQAIMQRNHARYRPSAVGATDEARAVRISLDGEPVAALRWDEEESWWLAADLADGTAVVVTGTVGTPVTTELRTVTDVEPLLAARRRHLLPTPG
ncbi:hypothetical protein [Nesterenkonia sp. F]|uniref:hypothetical protein n=1 Tax=Nesterenkonia sp. F TaxID=795955 RepID=UPI000255D9A8|nr:hypothetical protein [Nesterenkonia sp. F]